MSVFRRTSFLSFGSSCRALKASRRGLPTTATLCIRSRICSAAPSPCSIVKHHDWLVAAPERMAWCRGKLESVVRHPPAPLRFDSAGAYGDEKWDSFAGEAGVALLAHDRNDLLARRLVAVSVLSFHYSTTSRTLIRASQRREQLGEDFDRMLCLAVRWAGQRPALGLAQRLRTDTDAEDDHAGKEALIEEFVERRLPTELPDILELSAQAEREIEAVRARQSPELARMRRRESSTRRPGSEVETLHRGRLSVDTRVLSAAFAWLDLTSARPDERAKWLGLVRTFLDITLGLIPRSTIHGGSGPKIIRTSLMPGFMALWPEQSPA